MNEEAIKELYESISADYEVGTIDEFKAYLSDDYKRNQFFENVIKPEYDVQSIDEFESVYGLKKKADSTLETEDMVGTTEMGTTPGYLASSETPPVSIPVQEETLLSDGFDPSTLTAPLEDGSIPDPLDTEAKVLTELEIEPIEFKSWKEENLRPESKSYKFFKELLLNDEGKQYEDEQKIQKQVTAYLAQKLNKNLEAIDAADEEAQKVLIEQNRKDAQTIVNNLKAYKKETVIDDLESRKNLLRRQRAGGVKMAASTGFEMIKAAGNAAANFAMGTAAALFTEADALLNATGADKKGALLGIAEMFLDSAEHYSLDAGETQRATFVQGKEVISNGKTYIVSDDGVVYDEETHIRVDDILPETEVASIQDKASKIEGDSTSFDMGSGLTGLTSTIVNLFGLIRGGKKLQKSLGVNPKVGMGLMSFSSTVASSVESVKDDLMAQGVSEKEATNKALVFGSAIATLDGAFSALAGSNEKLLGSTKVVKDLLIDLAKKKGKDFSAQQLKRKAGDLIKENAKELFIEEIPVLLSERGINNVINHSVGMDVRAGVEDLKRADFMETAFLTLGATSGMGSKRLLTSNQRNDVVRYLSNNIKDVDVVSAKLVTDGLLTQQEADNAVSEVKSMQYAETKVSGAVKTTENMIEAAALIEKKEKLISERENTDPSLRADIDKRINSIDQQLEQLKQKDDKDVQDIINGEKDGEIKIEVTREEAVEALKAENEANERLGLPTIIESEANILKTQEKLIKERQDAIQKQETREVPDAEPAEGVQEVETEVRVTPEQEAEVESPIRDESEQTVSEIDDVTVTEDKVVPAGKRLFNNPNPETTEISKKYKKDRNNETPEGEPITSIDTENSRDIADVYESLEDSPNDPKVQEAYSLMADETAAQHQEIIDAGYEVEIWNGEGEPYANAQEMIDDVRDNKHMWIYSTEAGFGDTAITEEQRQQNKLLQDSGFKDKNGNTLLYNDLFRFVHDFFGHTERGNGFGPVGEENAWDVHSRMYTPLARRAMTTETRGQNSWVNFGPQMRNDKGELIKKGEEGYLSPRERAFAPQKMALMPELYSMLENEVEAGVSKLSQEFKGKPSMEEVYNKAEDLGITQKEAREYLNKIGYTEQEIKDFVFKREDMSVKKDVAGEKNIFVKGKNITLNFLDTIKRKLSSAKSYMPKNAFIAKETKNAHIQAEVKVAERIARRLNKMLKGQPDSVYNEVNKLMRGEEANLPIKISLIATAMRNHIDSLSEKLVMSGAVESEAAAANIMSNIGEYMNRSYRLFDDKNYADNISEEVILEAKEFLKAQELNRITKEAAKENITPQEYVNKQEGGKNFTLEQYVNATADQAVRRIIKKDEANAFVSAVVNEAKKDTKILKERKEIPAEIRALMGEYTDAAYNYVMSVGKIKAIIETQKYLDKLKDIGDGVFLFKEGDRRIPAGYTKIASETNKALEPLNGYYAPKELVDQMNSGPINVGKEWQKAFEVYMKAVGAVKYSKTILSIGTHAKNVLGNAYFMAQNGYFNPKDYNEAFKVLKNEFKNLDNEQLNKKLDEYIKAGIINQGVSLREVQGLLEGEQDFDVTIEKRTAKRSENIIKKGAKNLGKKLQDAYQAEDDLFKIVAYENEKRDYAKIEFDKDYNDLSEKEKAKVDSKVAEIVKNILPNYSRLGNISKILRAAPVATFISFQLEAYRTAFNTVDLALKEVKSENPRERKKGAKRLTSLIGFQALKYAALGMLGNGLLGDDDEDEEESKAQEVLEGAIGISKPKTGVMDARPFLPFWSQNSDILITKAGDGKFSYIDMSASDPYGGLAKVVRAAQRGDNVKDAVLDAGLELLNPIFSPDILAGALNTIIQNRDVYGKKVFEETDSADESAIKIIDVLYKTFEPGTLTSLRKIAGMDTPGKAYTDYGRYVTKMMKKENRLAEAIGQLTGFKKNDVDVEMQMNYKLGDLKEQMKPIEIKQYIAKKNIETTGDAREYVKLIKSEHADKDEVYQEASKLVKSAIKFGLTIEKIYPMLKSKFPKADDADIIFLYDQIASELMPKDE